MKYMVRQARLAVTNIQTKPSGSLRCNPLNENPSSRSGSIPHFSFTRVRTACSGDTVTYSIVACISHTSIHDRGKRQKQGEE